MRDCTHRLADRSAHNLSSMSDSEQESVHSSDAEDQGPEEEVDEPVGGSVQQMTAMVRVEQAAHV